MGPTPSHRGHPGAAQDRMIGRVLGGRYRVLSRLGEGGMGTVYLCEHAVLGRPYAVKLLRADLCRDAELGERFRNEAIAASQIGGENVVDVVDFGAEEDGTLYYVMEALEGRSLAVILSEEGPLEVGRVLALLDQVCRALGAAHARGVIHRDVKPDNVFVVRRPDGAELAKVIDFGISQVTPPAGSERITLAGSIIGTPEYMAPEQAAGDPIDERADVYALGVLAYELLTGDLPIVSTTAVATLVAHQTLAPRPPSARRPGIPPEVDALVLRALAKRPDDRPRNMAAFSAAIGEILRGLASSRAPARRRARGPALAAVLGFAVAAAAAAVAWGSGGGVEGEAASAAASPTGVATATASPAATSTSTPPAGIAPASAPSPSPSTTTTSTSTTTSTTTSKNTPAPAPATLSPSRSASAPRPRPAGARKAGAVVDRDGIGGLKDPYP